MQSAAAPQWFYIISVALLAGKKTSLIDSSDNSVLILPLKQACVVGDVSSFWSPSWHSADILYIFLSPPVAKYLSYLSTCKFFAQWLKITLFLGDSGC